MSEAHYEKFSAGLRFWDEKEILARERISNQIYQEVSRTLIGINQGWVFQRVETPVIMPRSRMNKEYSDNDVFAISTPLGEGKVALRAETTDGSYLCAEHILKTTRTKPPLCVWQIGKSFRQEVSDGATASKLRFNEFYQLEFQCIYAADTHADYAGILRSNLRDLVHSITGLETRLVNSDRIPSYSIETIDIEVLYNNRWTEVASTSMRTDFPESSFKKPLKVFEIAFGADRMVAACHGEP